MVRVLDLTKRFGLLTAVDRISFEIREGEIFGLLGPNGAGKTTTLLMMCGLLRPDAGEVLIEGEDVHRRGEGVRRKLGVVPQEVALYEELTAVENLRFWGQLYGIRGRTLADRVEVLLDFTGLVERANDRVSTYSGGMKRRLNLACGLVHHPKVLLLDEPTVGIDPQGRHNLLGLIRSLAQKGTTILYTTHYLDEAETLCDRLAIMDYGRLLTMGTPEEIRKLVGENRILHVRGAFEKTKAEELLRSIPDLSLLSLTDEEVIYSLPIQHETGRFVEMLICSGFHIDHLSIREPSLDSVFIKLTGRALRD